MADVIKEYAFKITVEGNKAVIKEFKAIDNQVKKGTGNLGKQNKELSKTNSLLWTYAKRLVSIYAIYKLFNKGISLATNFVEQGNALRNLSASANISARSLQKWGHLAKKYGGDEKSVASTMKNLNSSLYYWHEFGERGIFENYMKHFGDFPVSDNAEDFLLELANKLKGLSGREQEAILDSLGIGDEGLRLLLREGNLGDKLKNAPVLFTDEQIDKAQKVKDLMIDFNTELAKLNIALGELFLPTMIKFMGEIQKFLKNPLGYSLNKAVDIGKDFVKKGKYNPLNVIAQDVWALIPDEVKDQFKFNSALALHRINQRAKKDYFSPIGFSSDLLQALSTARFGVDNISVYNDNAININGTKTPEQVAQAVAGNIIGISDRSLTLAGLGFATKVK